MEKQLRVNNSAGDTTNGRMLICKPIFNCYHLERGFQGTDSYLVYKDFYYRVRIKNSKLMITPLFSKMSENREMEWTELESDGLRLYLESKGQYEYRKIADDNLIKQIKYYFGIIEDINSESFKIWRENLLDVAFENVTLESTEKVLCLV